MLKLDPHERPPDELRHVYKKYSKRDKDFFQDDATIIDLATGLQSHQSDDFSKTEFQVDERRIKHVLQGFLYSENQRKCDQLEDDWHFDGIAFESKTIDGLTVIPSLLPISVQKSLLSRIFHRDFADAKHKTNVDLHYKMTRPVGGESPFDHDPEYSQLVRPKDAEVHRPLTVGQLLNRKLRWMTLGGQYDWTAKVYPDETPPPFPQDIKDLLYGLFPQTTAEAAIVNLYSPGNTLSLHRDVSEECDHGLISVSIGCDCLFILGLEDEDADVVANENVRERREKGIKYVILRLRSGDALYMSRQSRFAWHGVPLIIPNTCPTELSSWPAEDSNINESDGRGRYAQWRNWMSTKRINLNVRQMKASFG